MSEPLLSRFKRERYIKVLEVETRKNGWIEAMVEFATLEHGCEMILSFGSLAEVITPIKLRNKVLEEALAIINKY